MCAIFGALIVPDTKGFVFTGSLKTPRCPKYELMHVKEVIALMLRMPGFVLSIFGQKITKEIFNMNCYHNFTREVMRG